MTDGNAIVIPVPKPAGKANKARKVNTLLEHQVRRLWEIEQRHIPDHKTGLTVKNPEENTEGEAAEYIRRMTAKLHELGPKPKRTRKRAAKPKANPQSDTKAS
jgi:hypothetical protein